MRETLGTIEAVPDDTRFVVKAEIVPKLDADVYGSDNKKIGNVKRIFGPIDGPYVTVTHNGKNNEDLLGKNVFINGECRDGKRKNKN